MSNQAQPTTTEGGRKLYSLTVKDAATANLIEIVNDPEWIDPPVEEESDDASGALCLGFWLLLAAPFVSLFLLGLLFGGGN